MYRKILMPFGFLAIIVTLGFLFACQKDEGVESTDNFVDNAVDQIQSRSGAGTFGCYELVFPVTLAFADSTTATVNSYEELRQAIHTWFEVNGGGHHGHKSRPTLVYPYQVTNDAGEIITVENDDQLKDLLAACRPGPGGPGNGGGNGGHGGHGHHGGDACYTLVFPITIQFPDSTQVTVASQEELRGAVHTWKENNPNVHGKYEIVFPITVTLKDGTQAVVNSKEELQAIKEACRG